MQTATANDRLLLSLKEDFFRLLEMDRESPEFHVLYQRFDEALEHALDEALEPEWEEALV